MHESNLSDFIQHKYQLTAFSSNHINFQKLKKKLTKTKQSTKRFNQIIKISHVLNIVNKPEFLSIAASLHTTIFLQ